MMHRPVAQYLVQFGPPSPNDAADEAQGDLSVSPPPDPGPGEICAPPLEIERDEAEAMASAEALSAMCAEHAAALAQERLSFEARLTAARASWTKEEGEQLSQKITSAFAEIEARIASSAARIMRPFLVDLLRRRTIDDLVENVGVLLAGKDHPVIEISGAEDLLEALREKLSGLPGAIAYAPNASIDVKVVADETMIDSRLAAWIERMKALPE